MTVKINPGYASSASECSTPPGSPMPVQDKSVKKEPGVQKRPRSEDDEEKQRRLLERKRRNRESAERSRQRRIQHYKTLETQCNKLKEENTSLRETKKKMEAEKKKQNADMAALREQIATLQKQLEAKNSQSDKPTKDTFVSIIDEIGPLEFEALDTDTNQEIEENMKDEHAGELWDDLFAGECSEGIELAIIRKLKTASLYPLQDSRWLHKNPQKSVISFHDHHSSNTINSEFHPASHSLMFSHVITQNNCSKEFNNRPGQFE
mmetsp:Transcript_45242/g.72590  ORF Transcript_45242/g.72590 Transcript_45242/m.72590 type:complete len:264 (+) Transcript_45242:141-932(+)|eukprot:CAMPEP_0203797636 /NCGR_PEP_ID=MMETSP0100_2-20121128/8755_1 /ASSEMBLY_ACC=CAM_ASM_000210 /TAXON_ID=96639 /ORGANISM=" , Strain NY0313808BC1" /LENGTH=263 /DNA_ID=CAMNT_0050702997 /DNA_START=81 /DNA_END=869 /DNA_ORIENTATION=-